jgi:diguanylate cyclase (GGDEF)-like protein
MFDALHRVDGRCMGISGLSASVLRTRLRVAERGHALHLWLIAGSIVLLAALVAVSITALRGHADQARQVQLIVTDVNADARAIRGVELEVEAGHGLSPELAKEFRLADRHIHGLLHAYERMNPADARQLDAQTRQYVTAVEKQLALRVAGRLTESVQLDERDVDPSFERLQRRLERIDVSQGQKAQTAAAQTDIGITASLLLAALVLIVVVWRLDTIRGAAGRRREEGLEVQALHDALTGLPNRRKLLLDLERAVLQADAGEHAVLVLCDLDGFKLYNDTFGHLEGDLLLGRLSAKLALTVAPHGTAYRLGGDEFCALLRIDLEQLAPVIVACHVALRESGRGFLVRASIGSVALPQEAADASAALRLADQRMYAQKNERGSSVTHQLRDLILRVLAEQDPELYDHVHDVARLAAGVGRRLALNDAQVADLVRAAELHDVGKVAIPDSILHKPGRLDPHEQEFMRRHTLIGESILSAAPALAGVGRLVRSSHERYDGAGYPDGLREEEIPLSSRIIFACDAFNAMTTDRPYRDAMNEEDALSELRRCAGTQFDPVVVDAFTAEFTALTSARRHVVEDPCAPEPAAAYMNR